MGQKSFALESLVKHVEGLSSPSHVYLLAINMPRGSLVMCHKNDSDVQGCNKCTHERATQSYQTI